MRLISRGATSWTHREPVTVRGPIIVLSDDINLFATVEGAERYLEPPDLRSGNILEIYDRDGRALTARVVKGFLGAERVKIEATDEAPQIERFRGPLIELLTHALGEPAECFSDVSLDQLIEKAHPYLTRSSYLRVRKAVMYHSVAKIAFRKHSTAAGSSILNAVAAGRLPTAIVRPLVPISSNASSSVSSSPI